MKKELFLALVLCENLISLGGVPTGRNGHSDACAGSSGRLDKGRASRLSAEVGEKILALDPEHVTENEVREVLSQAPAPRIINIHGGPLPIKARMISFSQFLVGMGYPETSLRNPKTGSYTFGYYHSSDKIAGLIAWHYEQEALRPMIVGHSMGGIQAVRVLYKLSGAYEKQIPVWNPFTDSSEHRYEITDPLTGTARPVVSLQVCYATAALSGGLGRVVPNEWDMNRKLRQIPDSVEEFVGFQKGFDIFGGDFLGYGPANEYHSMGKAFVRNVRLPVASPHWRIPDAKGLLEDQAIKDWISNYRPPSQAVDKRNPNPRFGLKTARALWAAEVWFSIKKHWVLELQRLIRAEIATNYGD